MKLTAPHRGNPRKLAIRSKKFPRSALPVSNRMWHLVNAAVLSGSHHFVVRPDAVR